MALLVLPMLAFVAAQDAAMQEESSTTQFAPGQLFERRRAVNGTELVLECAPAAHLVRTHMAPDFEHPQLVRRLDWIHESMLVASFQQVEKFCGKIKKNSEKAKQKVLCPNIFIYLNIYPTNILYF